MTTATAGVVAALTMKYFNVPFEVAWAVMFIQLFWLVAHTLLFGEPYAPGWITPALPLVMGFLAQFEPGLAAIQAMTAVTICVCAIFLFFAVTGLGSRFFEWVPLELRAAIIFGGAISAFNAEFGRLEKMPYTLPIVWGIVFLLMFSVWFSKAKDKVRFFKIMASMALLVGFLVAAIVGPLFGELSFDIKMGWHIPQLGTYIKAVSPFSVGWPGIDVFIKALPLAIMIYIFVFGDLVLGNTLIEQASAVRKDEKIIVNNTRTHFTLFFKNIGHFLMAGPFIPLHGPMWTGVHVFLIERYKTGHRNMKSLYDGLFNWYWPAFILSLLVPVVTFMKPLLPVALSITLILTGFACAYIAISMVNKPASQGYAFFVGMVIAKFGPAWGLCIGVGLYFLLVYKKTPFTVSKA
ncbi:permease [Desulfosarcina ovata subsp. ovata]|uniref:Permease n=1 Tax=Desulfosarcina ovata subsp. ovata TaxID=2752305 RepID=A0A5K8AHV8_9BACT|nr:permease [Desulfosarcina ovata subsp. ovata]